MNKRIIIIIIIIIIASLNTLVHDLINLLHYEHWTDK